MRAFLESTIFNVEGVIIHQEPVNRERHNN